MTFPPGQDHTLHEIDEADGSDICRKPQYDVRCEMCGRVLDRWMAPELIADEIAYHEHRYHRHEVRP